jgi:biopolymer transport protein ExbD
VVTTLAITMTENGDIYLDGVKTDKATLSRTVGQAHSKNKELRVVIAADKRVTHGAVVSVIDLVRRLGVTKFAINIDAPDKGD